MEADIDDTHLCIKCNQTIVGLENYIEHRKSSSCNVKTERVTTEITHPYRPFDYPGTPNFIKTGEVEKTPKSLTDAYDLPYDLGADVFFSSLELQSSSKRSTNPSATPSSISGKASSTRAPTRKAAAAASSNHEPEDEWIPASTTNNSESLMKAVRDISGNKKFDSMFKLLPFPAESPEQTDDEEIDVEEDFVASGSKWKSDNCHNVTRPIFPKSPMWDARHQWDINPPVEFDLTPPPSHTRGKWVPGTKTYKLSYKDDAECEKISNRLQWCNTCNRGLATKLLYEKHLKTNLHLKRKAPEQQLERSCLNMGPLSRHYSSIIEKPPENINKSTLLMSHKRKRIKTVFRCEICRVRMPKHLIGKHLISHFHYRRMTLNPTKSYDMILENMHRVVFQSPFQCKPCRFYANTEKHFLLHWRSDEHHNVITKAPGKFWCFLCKFECNDNDEMENHLLGFSHQEVTFVINRSFPIVIQKRIAIHCNLCKASFQYNIELRKHSDKCTRLPINTASDDYQSKHICKICGEICKSRLSLQRHGKFKHGLKCFFCTICRLEFNTRIAACKHRNSSLHKNTTKALQNKRNSTRKCPHCEMTLPNLLKLKEHIDEKHSDCKHACSLCNAKFTLPQDLGRHVRDRICQPSTSKAHIDKSHLLKKSVKTENANDSLAVGCLQCNFKPTLHAELIFHQILHSFKEPINVSTKISCPLCKKKFRKHSLRFHLRQHTNEKLFDCKLCEMKFSRKQNLKTHVENIHEKKNIPKDQNKLTPTKQIEEKSLSEIACEICGKVFNRKYLKRHISTHMARDKKYSCPVETCYFSANFYSDLAKHMENQHNDMEIKRFHCDFEDCDYKGKSQTLLMRHKAMMHKPVTEKHKCTLCKFYTKIPGHLKRHMRSHTGEKPFKCPHCDYVCSTSEYLRKHVISTKQHPGKYLYECDLCGKYNSIEIFKTNFQRDFRAHLAITHADHRNIINGVFKL